MNFFLLIINSELIVSFRENGFIKQNSQKKLLELFINIQIILYNLKSIEYNIDDYIKNF